MQFVALSLGSLGAFAMAGAFLSANRLPQVSPPGSPGQSSVQSSVQAPVDFGAEIRPLLSDRCFTCHGPGAEDPGGGLRLDVEDEAVDADGFSAIVPGDASASELVERLWHENPKRRMPPADSNLALTSDEIALLTRWIDEGANYGEHWAFVRPERTPRPDVEGDAWCRDDLDRFVLAKLERLGIEPAPAADDLTLLRRVSMDLTGLPPTAEEVQDYLADSAPGRYERTVDRLLSSTAHAEHLTAHWLDVARYADTFGYQSDVNTNVWPWRDWALRAFERNQPYDEFLTHQIAGDLVPDANQESRLATAFSRLHRQTNEGGSVEEEFRVEYVCDRVETMAGAFLGLTVGCARCHDHKFDPISQRDYFGLFAYFDGIDESGLYSHFTRSTPTPALDLPSDAQSKRLGVLERLATEAEARVAGEAATPLPWRTTFQANLSDVVEDPVEGGGTRRIVKTTQEGGAVAELRGNVTRVDVEGGAAALLDGENSIAFPGTGAVKRSAPLSIELSLLAPEAYERAVVIHRTKSWTDSGSRGYQLLIEDGHLVVAFVHFWPGDAIAIRSKQPIPVGSWTRVRFDYDGSSRAAGLALWVDGERAPVTTIRDHLTRTIVGGSIEHLTIGSRFRDRGFKGGMVRDIVVRELDDAASPAYVMLRDRRAERDALRDQVRQIMTMRQTPDLLAARRTAYVLHRGVYSERRDPIGPATPAFLTAQEEEAKRGGSRLDLARWLTHPDHPLTARVHVDRLWRHAFRSGLVATAADFGSQTPEPVHRALLDTLARDLVASGWDSRAMLRRFVLSATYRQSSVRSAAARADDPNGQLHSHAHRTRFDAETIRDALLRASGRLVSQSGGASVLPYQPPGLWKEKSGHAYKPGRGDDLRRRSMYTFWRRTSPPPTMTMFDAPSREVCRVERPSTTTPLQSLVLWNDPQFVDVSLALAHRAIEAAGDNDAARVEHIVMALATRPATASETAAMAVLLSEQRKVFRETPEAARALARYDLETVAHGEEPAAQGEHSADTAASDVEVAATAVVASALLGLDDVVLRR